MNTAKISIIIPVYNVEKYLAACVDSVRNQSVTELQIILVDDGSTDGSSALCDAYARQDTRITVIHKENGGLSDARNAGLPAVEGDFILYLDSDDYLEPDALAALTAAQAATGADIVVGNYYYTYSDHEDAADYCFKKDECLSAAAAMEALVIGKIQNFAWGKLIRAGIAKKHLFPKGKLFEDHYWAHLVFADAAQVMVLSKPLVHYRQREDSISYTHTLKRLDVLDGWLERKKFLDRCYPELTALFLRHIAQAYLSTAWLTLTRMKKQRREAFALLRAFNRSVHLENYVDDETRRLIRLLDRGVWLYCIGEVFNKIKHRG